MKQHLGSEQARMEAIKATATFHHKIDVTQRDEIHNIPSFEKTVIEHALERSKGKKRDNRPYPSIAQVLLTSACNRLYSDRTNSNNRKASRNFFDPRSFLELIRGLLSLNVKFIDFSGGEEPTLHPQFHKLSQTCFESGFRLAITTNASWANCHITEFLLEDFSFLRIALDASHDRVYDRLRGSAESGKFGRVLGNIETLVRQRERMGAQLVAGVIAGLTQTNMNFVEEMTRLSHDLGLDYIQFRVRSNNSDFLLPEQRERVSKLVDELRGAFHPFPVYNQIEINPVLPGCWFSPFQAVIDTCGDLYPCLSFRRRREVHSFGNLLNQPVEKLWCNPKHRQEAELLKKHHCSLSDCPWHFCNYPSFHAHMASRLT